MAQGLRVWDANGVLVLDTSNRAGRFVGRTGPTTAKTGTFSIPIGVTPFVIAIRYENGEPYGYMGTYRVPDITFSISGNTLTWTISGEPSGSEFLVVCGVF